jgi:hypothetical protein
MVSSRGKVLALVAGLALAAFGVDHVAELHTPVLQFADLGAFCCVEVGDGHWAEREAGDVGIGAPVGGEPDHGVHGLADVPIAGGEGQDVDATSVPAVGEQMCDRPYAADVDVLDGWLGCHRPVVSFVR